MLTFFDKKYALEKYSLDSNQMSFSRWMKWRECPLSLFTRYMKSDVPVLAENTYALPGWTIQKLLEIHINYRLYEKDPFGRNILSWIKPLTELIVFPLSLPLDRNHYFETQEGMLRIEKYISLGLDPIFLEPDLDLQPFFIDENKFLTVNKSWDRYYIRIENTLRGVLELWARDSVDLSCMKCEVPLSINLESFEVTGRADFLYYHPETSSYTILDGKMNLSRFVHSEQLQLYSSMFHSMNGFYPRWLQFLEYSGFRYKTFQPDPLFLSRDFIPDLISIRKDLEYFYLTLSSLPSETFTFTDIPLIPLRPSDTACAFCALRDGICPTPMPSDTTRVYRSRQNKSQIMKEFGDKRGINYITF